MRNELTKGSANDNIGIYYDQHILCYHFISMLQYLFDINLKTRRKALIVDLNDRFNNCVLFCA